MSTVNTYIYDFVTGPIFFWIIIAISSAIVGLILIFPSVREKFGGKTAIRTGLITGALMLQLYSLTSARSQTGFVNTTFGVWVITFLSFWWMGTALIYSNLEKFRIPIRSTSLQTSLLSGIGIGVGACLLFYWAVWSDDAIPGATLMASQTDALLQPIQTTKIAVDLILQMIIDVTKVSWKYLAILGLSLMELIDIMSSDGDVSEIVEDAAPFGMVMGLWVVVSLLLNFVDPSILAA